MSGKSKNYKNCKNCGIELVKKNATYSTYDKVKGTYTFKSTCNYCARKFKTCLVNYDNPVLQQLAMRQNELIQKRLWHHKVAKPKREAAKIPYSKPEECNSCGVQLSEKNEHIIKSRVNNRATRCSSCVYGTNYCLYVYPTKELEELSKVQCKVIRRKLYKKKNFERIKYYTKRSFLKYKNKYYKKSASKSTKFRETLHDTYVRTRILQTIPGLIYEDVTSELIEIKRKQLLIKRKLKNQGIWVR
jgi:hypothetical protein